MTIDDPDRTHADETRRKLFVRRHLTEMSPVWPGAQSAPPFDPASLSGAIRDRVDAVLNVALSGFVGSVGRFLLAPIRRTIRAKVTDKAVSTLADALKAHRLDDPFG